MEFLADIYLFAGLVCRLFGLKRLSKRLKEKGDALLERCTDEIDQDRREQEAREEKARKHREEAIRLERQKCFADPERNTQAGSCTGNVSTRTKHLVMTAAPITSGHGAGFTTSITEVGRPTAERQQKLDH